MAVLDTSALLNWPIERCRGQIVSMLQQSELASVDEQRWLLIETLEMDWRTATIEERQTAIEIASKTGDLPRLSDVDIDLLFELRHHLHAGETRLSLVVGIER